MFEGSNNTHDTGQNSVVGIHGLERLLDTDTVLDQHNGGIFSNHRLELFCSTWTSLDAFMGCNDVFEIDVLQARVRRCGNGY